MFIKLSSAGAATLEESDNFKAFKVVSEVAPEHAAAALGGAGKIDGEHAWIEPAWLRQSGPDDAAWRAGLEKMLEYAGKSGWVNGAGAVRAHIEWL
jgi:hypothetical protein